MFRLKYLSSLLLLPLLGLTPVHNVHKEQSQTDAEFKNLYQGVQPIEFRVFDDTPALKNVKDGQIFIVDINTTTVNLMFRSGEDIYNVKASCVTVSR